MSVTPEFRKSSYSQNSNACVEVADTPGGHLVRDTQHRDAGHLGFVGLEWSAFLAATQADRR